MVTGASVVVISAVVVVSGASVVSGTSAVVVSAAVVVVTGASVVSGSTGSVSVAAVVAGAVVVSGAAVVVGSVGTVVSGVRSSTRSTRNFRIIRLSSAVTSPLPSTSDTVRCSADSVSAPRTDLLIMMTSTMDTLPSRLASPYSAAMAVAAGIRPSVSASAALVRPAVILFAIFISISFLS